jgi:hypothetical protein
MRYGPSRVGERKERRGWWSRVLPLACLVAVWLAFDYPALFGRVLFPVEAAARASPYDRYGGGEGGYLVIEGDAFNQYFPLRSYLAKRLVEGDFPLWDPHRLAGTPFAANPQAGVWYPPNWLYATGEVLTVYSWLAVLSRLGALFLYFWFLRVLRVHPFGAVVGATIFTFSGFFTAWTTHPSFIASGMWLPLALGGIHLTLTRGRWEGAGLAGLGLGLSVLGGQPQVILYVWLATLLWATILIVAGIIGAGERGSWAPATREAVGASARVGVAFALAAGLAAVQLLASAELQDDLVRQEEPYAVTVRNALPARHLSTLALPDRLGNPRDDTNVSGDFLNYSETAVYAGILGLALAMIGAVRRRDRATAAFLVLGALGVLAALGTPVYRLVYEAVPWVSRTRIPARFVFLVDVAIAGLAAFGVDAIIRKSSRGPLLIALAAASALVWWAASIEVAGVTGSYVTGQVIRALVVLAAGGGALWLIGRPRLRSVASVAVVAAVAADLWLFGFDYHPFQRPAAIHPRTPEINHLAAVPGTRPRFARLGGWLLPPGIALQHELYDLQLWDNVILRRPVEVLALASPIALQVASGNAVGFFDGAAFRSPVMDLFGVRGVLGPVDARGLGAPEFSAALAIFPRPSSLPPAFLAPCWERVETQAILGRLAAMDSDEMSSVALVPAERDLALPRPAAECRPGAGEVRVETYEAERVSIRSASSRPGVLVLTDTWYPGWEATVDGRAVPVLQVDWTFRGVVVPPGRHVVEFRYRPVWLVPGLALSLGSALIVLLLVVAPRLRRRRGAP